MRLLDLFCGAGGAAMGYHRAGFDITGVDQQPQPDYPFRFVQADAMDVLADSGFLAGFDVVHASPPCQGESVSKVLNKGVQHERLLQPTLNALITLKAPWVVENVPGADVLTEFPRVRVCGSAFDLRIRRHRWFWSNVPLFGTVCNHATQKGRLVGVYGASDGLYPDGFKHPGTRRGPRQVTTPEAREVMGMPWVTNRRGLTEAIPPAYTEWIGRQLASTLEA